MECILEWMFKFTQAEEYFAMEVESITESEVVVGTTQSPVWTVALES